MFRACFQIILFSQMQKNLLRWRDWTQENHSVPNISVRLYQSGRMSYCKETQMVFRGLYTRIAEFHLSNPLPSEILQPLCCLI